MKRFVNMLLIISLIMSLSVSNIFASSSDEKGNSIEEYIGEIDGGNMYVQNSEEKKIAILTNDAEHLVNISIVYAKKPDVSFEWIIEDYPVDVFDINNPEFWMNVVEYAEMHMDEARYIQFTESSSDDDDGTQIQPHSSAKADLLAKLESLEGEEYSGRFKYSEKRNGNTFSGYIAQSNFIRKTGAKSWSTKISVASLITSILGEVATSTLVTGLCGIFGVAASATSVILAGTVDVYSCTADEYKYITANGSKYIYNITDKFINYKGYDNPNNNKRAFIDKGSKEINYGHGKDYYSSYSKQVDDAYTMFERIGQKD